MKLTLYTIYISFLTLIISVAILILCYLFLLNKHENKQCIPINRAFKEFKVQIDGEIYPKYVRLSQNNSINFECLNKKQNIKQILLWNRYYGDEDFDYGIGSISPFQENQCPVTKCSITNDIKFLNQSDLVVVHMRDGFSAIPRLRPAHQQWVFLLWESPIHSIEFKELNGVFNLTATYKTESDFSSGYESLSRMTWKRNNSFNANFDYLSAKSKFIAAMITNCGAPNHRLEFIRELDKHMKVDVFGQCGKRCFPFDETLLDREACRKKIASEYMFFLAVENSICKEYVTEKFFTLLQYNVIPLVIGEGNYSYYVPKSGFINVLDFKSIKSLADYLKYLSKNKTAYNSYFSWKKYVSFNSMPYRKKNFFYGIVNPFCEMCIYLHLQDFTGIKTSIIKKLDVFWSRPNDCKNNSILKSYF